MKLSVIICTYNRDKYIYNVLKSIAENDFSQEMYEIVLVNNNSSDNTSGVCIKFANDFPLVDFRPFIELNQGISHARNRGVLEATGDIIVFIDDDETVKPDFLSSIQSFFQAYPQAGLCAGPVEPVYEAEKPAWLSHFTLRVVTGYYNHGDEIKLLSGKDYPGTGHASLRKQLFDKYGIFNTNLGRKGKSLIGAEDKDFFLRVINAGEKCYYLPQALIFHHIPAEKLTEDFFEKITYAIGVSERIRTLSVSKGCYFKRLLSESVKWSASILLYCLFFIKMEKSKGIKLIEFRINVTKGLIGQ